MGAGPSGINPPYVFPQASGMGNALSSISFSGIGIILGALDILHLSVYGIIFGIYIIIHCASMCKDISALNKSENKTEEPIKENL